MIAHFLRKLFNGHKTKGAAITAPFYYSKTVRTIAFVCGRCASAYRSHR